MNMDQMIIERVINLPALDHGAPAGASNNVEATVTFYGMPVRLFGVDALQAIAMHGGATWSLLLSWPVLMRLGPVLLAVQGWRSHVQLLRCWWKLTLCCAPAQSCSRTSLKSWRRL